jgi:hypothetical protein
MAMRIHAGTNYRLYEKKMLEQIHYAGWGYPWKG